MVFRTQPSIPHPIYQQGSERMSDEFWARFTTFEFALLFAIFSIVLNILGEIFKGLMMGLLGL
jgi:hypothetical protein